MGNVHMEATQINYRGGSKKMSVEEAIKAAGTEITPEEKAWIDTIPELASQEIIAPEFDAEEGVYAVGDLVIYQGGLYKFTTAHETAGAWNPEEVAAVKVSEELSSLESGLTNYENQNNLNLEVPNRKNILPMTINYLKSINDVGTWSGNVYSRNGINFTVQTDAKNNVTGIAVSGTATANSFFVLYKNDAGISQFVGCVLNGVQSGDGIGGTYGIGFEAVGAVQYNGNDYTIPSLYSSKTEIYIRVSNGVQLDTVIYPMIRPASITDPTFAPYIPSVESRLDAVESGVAGLTTTYNVEGSATDLSLWANDNGVVVLSTYIAAIDKRVGFKRAADGTISSYESD